MKHPIDFIVYGFTEQMLDRIDLNRTCTDDILALIEAQSNDPIWYDNDRYIETEEGIFETLDEYELDSSQIW